MGFHNLKKFPFINLYVMNYDNFQCNILILIKNFWNGILNIIKKIQFENSLFNVKYLNLKLVF